MRHSESVAMAGQATFGRDGAMFESLLGFVAQLSVVLWTLVILTVVIRFVGIRIYRRGAALKALGATVAPSATVPAAGQLTNVGLGLFGSTAARKDGGHVPAGFGDVLATGADTNAMFDEALPPAAVAASVTVPGSAPHNGRAESRSAAHVTPRAFNSRRA